MAGRVFLLPSAARGRAGYLRQGQLMAKPAHTANTSSSHFCCRPQHDPHPRPVRKQHHPTTHLPTSAIFASASATFFLFLLACLTSFRPVPSSAFTSFLCLALTSSRLFVRVHKMTAAAVGGRKKGQGKHKQTSIVTKVSCSSCRVLFAVVRPGLGR